MKFQTYFNLFLFCALLVVGYYVKENQRHDEIVLSLAVTAETKADRNTDKLKEVNVNEKIQVLFNKAITELLVETLLPKPKQEKKLHKVF